MKKNDGNLGNEGSAWFRKVKKSFDFAPHEIELLRTAAACLDRIESARVSIEKDGLIVSDTRGAVKKHPAAEIEVINKKLFLDYCKSLRVLTDENVDATKKR
jgi:hypothetical protein